MGADGPRFAALRDVAAGVAAPMIAAYVLWVLQDAAARGLERVHFLARDGQILHAVARRLAPVVAPATEPRYLAASRQVWVRAISASPDHHWLWYGGGAGASAGAPPGTLPGPTLAAILRRLAVPREAVAADLARLGLVHAAAAADPSWDSPLDAAALARLRPYLEGPAFAAAAAPARAANRARLLAHLGEAGLLDPAPQAVVDLGWSGSLHDALCDLLAAEGRPPVPCFLFGQERVRDPRWLDHRRAFLFDLARGEGASVFDRLEDQRGFLEVFCAADHGTVTGLAEGPAGRIVPEVDPTWAAPVAAWGIGTVQATVAAFADALAADLAARPLAPDAAAAFRPTLAALLRAFWLDPTPAEAAAWGAFPFNLGEGHGSFTAPLAEPYRPADLVRVLRDSRALRRHEHFWIAGALALTPAPLRAALLSMRALRGGLGTLRRGAKSRPVAP